MVKFVLFWLYSVASVASVAEISLWCRLMICHRPSIFCQTSVSKAFDVDVVPSGERVQFMVRSDVLSRAAEVDRCVVGVEAEVLLDVVAGVGSVERFDRRVEIRVFGTRGFGHHRRSNHCCSHQGHGEAEPESLHDLNLLLSTTRRLPPELGSTRGQRSG